MQAPCYRKNKCKHLTERDSCKIRYQNCPRWRLWFAAEWQNIRKAAELIKAEKEKKEGPEA